MGEVGVKNISGNKIKIFYIMVKVGLYEVCVYPTLFHVFFIILLIYYHPFFLKYLWHLSHQGQVVKEVFSMGIQVRIVQTI